jgi:hypothetical protein
MKKIAPALAVALTTMAAAGAFAAPANAAAVDSTCNFARTFCGWDQGSYAGSRFTAQANNASTRRA